MSSDLKPNYYQILGVNENANQDTIKQQHKKLWDKINNSRTLNETQKNKQFTELDKAYSELMKPYIVQPEPKPQGILSNFFDYYKQPPASQSVDTEQQPINLIPKAKPVPQTPVPQTPVPQTPVPQTPVIPPSVIPSPSSPKPEPEQQGSFLDFFSNLFNSTSDKTTAPPTGQPNAPPPSGSNAIPSATPNAAPPSGSNAQPNAPPTGQPNAPPTGQPNAPPIASPSGSNAQPTRQPKIISNSSASGTSEKKTSVPVPNQLNITIQTNIPGYQKIIFKPSMVMKDSSKDDTSVQFNPLIKLDKAKIDQVPENYRKKQFFNKGLFQSLINFINARPVETLTLAKRYGYIDNNIRITLQNILGSGSVINIGGKPYTIADFRWTTGDWKVDTKQKKEELDPNRITDPYLYSQLVKENLVTGEEQLQRLQETSPDIIYGSSFTGPKNATARGPSATASSSSASATASSSSASASASSSSVSASASSSKPATPTSSPTRQVTLSPTEVKKIEVATLKPECDKDPKIKLDPSNSQAIRSSQQVRSFFTNQSWISLLDNIYSNNEQTKTEINNLLKNSTDVAIQGGRQISRSAYNKLVEGLQVNWNAGGGDCFFIAVAQAINYYNCTNPNTRIIKEDGTGDQIFTQEDIRKLVLQFFKQKLADNDTGINGTTYKNDLTERLNFAKNDLNEQFINTLSQLNEDVNTIDEALYLEIIDDIYGNGSKEGTFLIQNPSKKPTTYPESPFTIVENYEYYLLSSNYWGDQLAFEAILNLLKINIIIIDQEEGLRVAHASSLSTDENNIWDKYLFLYSSGGHFELLSFTMAFKTPGIRENTTKKLYNKVTIFERESEIKPPIYIIFLLFFTSYLTTTSLQNTFSILPDQMELFKESLDAQQQQPIQQQPIQQQPIQQQPIQKQPIQKQIEPQQQPRRNPRRNVIFKGTYPQGGGAFPSYYPSSYPYQGSPYQRSPYQGYPYQGSPYQSYPYQSYPYNARPYLASRMVKTENQYDPSKLAFEITIGLELYPGENVPKEKLAALKCDSRWEDVRKAWAEFVGKPYVIIPKYQSNNKTQRYNPYQSNNKTQRYNPYQRNSQNQRQRYNPFQRSKYNQTQRYRGGLKTKTKRKI